MVADALYAVLDWLREHIAEIVLLLGVCGAVALIALLAQHAQTEHQQQIDLCIRAFDYTRDQCEFIVTNHVMVSK